MCTYIPLTITNWTLWAIVRNRVRTNRHFRPGRRRHNGVERVLVNDKRYSNESLTGSLCGSLNCARRRLGDPPFPISLPTHALTDPSTVNLRDRLVHRIRLWTVFCSYTPACSLAHVLVLKFLFTERAGWRGGPIRDHVSRSPQPSSLPHPSVIPRFCDSLVRARFLDWISVVRTRKFNATPTVGREKFLFSGFAGVLFENNIHTAYT